MNGNRILLAGIINNYTLERSYATAAEKMGFQVLNFDLVSKANTYVKLNKLGRVIHRFLPVEAWTKKMNRELIITAKEYDPDILLFFTTGKILYGTIATLKAIKPNLKVAWIWSDTPLNLQQHNYNSGQLVDVTATYSLSTIESFKMLGFNNVMWVPLAGDKFMHHAEIKPNNTFECDISFVGGWRPEREKVLKVICYNYPNKSIQIHGPLWKQKVKDRVVSRNIRGEGFFALKLAMFFNNSRININQIDDTNYPAANMRFFEVCTAGGLQLTSSCPEMENEFIHKKHLLYYKNEIELVENIDWIFKNQAETDAIRLNGQQLINFNHTYTNRLELLLKDLKISI